MDCFTDRTVWTLAGMADVGSPDSVTSPGALWLQRVAGAASELEADRDGDDVAELADSLVPIYTHERWQVFVDLAAYNEELDDLGGPSGDMTNDAGAALYMIAERLLMAVAEDDR